MRKRLILTQNKSVAPDGNGDRITMESTSRDAHILNFLATMKGYHLAGERDISMTVDEYTEELAHYYESIIACMPNNIYWMDRECILLGGNHNLVRLFGLQSGAELAGLTFEEMAELANWTEGQGQAFKKSALNVISTGIPQFNVEEPAIVIDGKTRHFISSKVPMFNTKREVIGMIGVSTDITERKRETVYLKDIINKLPGNIYWKNRKGVYLGCSSFVLQMAGMKDVVGKTDFDMPWKESAHEIRSIDEMVIKTNKPIEVEENPTLSDGRQITLLTRKAPLKDDKGNIIGIIGISIDITERKKLELVLKEAKDKAEAANKAKAEFLENMRHDIRTPLTGIVGFASIIASEVSDPKIKEYVDNLTASSHALLDLLNEILEIVKLNSGEVPVLKKKFSLKKRLSDIIQLNQAKASYKDIDLLFDYDPNIPQYLIGDSTKIHRIALELVTNALNFTNKGYVKLSVKLAKKTESDVVVKLIVEDSGIGIPSHQQQDIFLQFKRLTPSYEGRYKGSGLGLAIVRKFLDEIEGEIYIESELKVGTKFTCLIPLKVPLLDEEFGCETVASAERPQLHEANLPTRASGVDNKEAHCSYNKILVVEDQVVASMIAKNMLSDLKCEVDVAVDGQAAVRLAQKNQYDLIFMDIGLPDITGYEVAKRIRSNELDKETHIPIIALTAHVDEENKQRCIEAGMSAVITKPLAKEKAKDILAAFIPQRTILEAQQKSDSKERFDLLAIRGKVIDLEAAKQVLGEEEAIYPLLNILRSSLEEEVVKLHIAYKEEQWPVIQAIAHKIKGSCSYIGAMRLKEVCIRLESSIKGNKIQLAIGLYNQMLVEIKAITEAIETEVY